MQQVLGSEASLTILAVCLGLSWETEQVQGLRAGGAVLGHKADIPFVPQPAPRMASEGRLYTSS